MPEAGLAIIHSREPAAKVFTETELINRGWVWLCRVATVREKVLENEKEKSGNNIFSQGNLKKM